MAFALLLFFKKQEKSDGPHANLEEFLKAQASKLLGFVASVFHPEDKFGKILFAGACILYNMYWPGG